MPDHISQANVTHGAALRITVKAVSRLSDGTAAITTGHGAVITIAENDAKKIAALYKEQP